MLVRNGTFVASDSNYFDYAAEIAAHAQNINECTIILFRLFRFEISYLFQILDFYKINIIIIKFL